MNEYLSYKGVSKVTGLDSETIRSYRKRGTLPEPTLVVDNKPLWNKDEILQWDKDRPRRQKYPDPSTVCKEQESA
jgi:predicted DNA-binding transcriptional regulator AlpA